MGREEENRRPWCGQAALARPTPHRVSGAALGGPHGAVYFPSGTKGQQPLVFPALAGLRGRAAAPADLDCAEAQAIGVPRGTPHARIVTRQGRDTGTVARLARASVPIEPHPAGSRPYCQQACSGFTWSAAPSRRSHASHFETKCPCGVALRRWAWRCWNGSLGYQLGHPDVRAMTFRQSGIPVIERCECRIG